tara:strand:- start:5305 stop:5763 length:459 start_codon:yes stop_codon:yes gene_type:complete
MSKVITVYTDGACRGNPGIGGWGAYIIKDNDIIKIKGNETNTELFSIFETTNNRMEITAAIEALKFIDKNSEVKIYTDSKYLKDGITEWLCQWKLNGWKTSSNKKVKNIDLWLELDNLIIIHNIEWNWIKGHSGDLGNDEADRLANEAIDEI